MTAAIAVATDVVAIGVLTFGLYHRRHGRRDLLLAFVALNTGVLAVTLALSSAGAGLGLGLGLFGILSIIRLRSDQIAQEEIAYYFTALALGLLAGLHPDPAWVSPALAAGIVLTIALVDAPWMLRSSRRIVLTLDAAYPDDRTARAAVERLVGGRVRQLVVLEADLVRDVTVVDVRYVRGAGAPAEPRPAEPRPAVSLDAARTVEPVRRAEPALSGR